MRIPILPSLVVFAVISAPSVALGDSAAATAARLGSGIETRTVAQPDTDVRWGQATAVVDAPFEQVKAIVEDYSRYNEFLPHFERSRVLSQRGPNALVYLEANVIHGTVTLWAQMRMFARRQQGDTHVIEAKMLKGNMDAFAGRWELTPLDGGNRTLVQFRLIVDPDLPLPSSVFTKENRKSARKTLRALREQAAQRRSLAQN
jgi:ribosome-associated toxin RatA of RatAB toxin-antitoxin module